MSLQSVVSLVFLNEMSMKQTKSHFADSLSVETLPRSATFLFRKYNTLDCVSDVGR